MKYIPNNVSRLVGNAVLLSKARSPKVLFVAGVVGVGATVVLACRATLKLDRTLPFIETEHQMLVDNNTDKKDMTFFYVRTAKELAIMYAPAIAVGAASVACLTGAHNILTSRNVALTAAYAGLEQTFSDYRKRVFDDQGAEADAKYRYGSELVSETRVDDKGKLHTVDSTRPAYKASLYARFFDETCENWHRRQDYNMVFLEIQQKYWNERLHAKGHVFLNEVYDSLGFERSQAGQIMGWMVTSDHRTDEFIDFGVFNIEDERKRAFVNGYESAILLDFNVTNIYNNI